MSEEKTNNNSKKVSAIFMKNKKLLIVIALLIVFIVLINVGYSLFSDEKKDETSLKVGEINVIIKEDPEWEENEDEFGIKKYTKSVKGVSVAELDSYVRVKCIPTVEYYVEGKDGEEGKWITAPVSQDNIVMAINTENWVEQDGYWYYTKILKGYGETDSINIDWQVEGIPSEINSYPIRTDVRVNLEYAQVTNNMWKSIFQIENLPQEVEQVNE